MKQFLKCLSPPGIKLIPNSVTQRRNKPTRISDKTVSWRPTYLQFREVNFNESTGWFAATRRFFPRVWRQVDSNYCNRTQSMSEAATLHPLAMANVSVNGTTFKTNVLDSSTLKLIKTATRSNYYIPALQMYPTVVVDPRSSEPRLNAVPCFRTECH